jgi:hypothetical protein
MLDGHLARLLIFSAKLAKMHRNEQTNRCSVIFRLCVVIGVTMGVLLLAACGQKGDLYLPADVPPVQQQSK